MELKDILPVLQRNDWRGKDTAVTRPYMEMEEKNSILISLAEVQQSTNAYITEEYLNVKSRSFSDFEIDAMVNLQKHEMGTWNLSEPKPDCKILGLRHDEMTSSFILIKKVMLEAHEKLNADLMYVAVPDRFTILTSDDPMVLLKMAKGFYQDAMDDENGAPLSSRVMAFVKGKAEGYLKVEDEEEDDEPTHALMLNEELLAGPLCIFLMVAGADGEIDEKEMNSFRKFIQDRIETSTPSIKKYLFAAAANMESIQESIKDALPLQVLMDLARALAEGVPEKMAEEIRKMLVEMAYEIAGASGGFMGLGNKVSKSEKEAIAAIESTLNIFALINNNPEGEGDEDEDDEEE